MEAFHAPNIDGPFEVRPEQRHVALEQTYPKEYPMKVNTLLKAGPETEIDPSGTPESDDWGEIL